MFIRKLFLACCLLPVCLTAADVMPVLDFDPPPRVIKLDPKKAITLTGKNVEIVVPKDAGGPARFAGKELQTFLNQIFSAKIPIRNVRSSGAAHAIILGDSALSRKAGIRVDKLGRDAFYMKTIGKDIYIAGRDDKWRDTERLLKVRNNWFTSPFLHHRATLFGAYEFLERFCGVRFYFNGPMGTVVPKAASVKVPGIDIFERPDNIVRRFQHHRYKKEDWYMNEDLIYAGNMVALRLRLETREIPNCHGLAHLGFIKRFGKSNPEYFALKKDGTRFNTWNDDFPGQLCLTSPGLRNEIFNDAVSALKGEPPTKRGVVYASKRNQKGVSLWAPPLYRPGFFNVHLQDGCTPCLCANCQKLLKSDKPGKHSTEWVWEMTADIANRVKKAGVKGYITQMAYHFYVDVPKVKLPDNVLVQVALAGPWASNSPALDKYDRDLLAAWHKKLGKRVWLWNYTINGRGESAYSSRGVPHHSPMVIGKYFQARSKDICGAFILNSTNNDYIHEAMNHYVSMKILWNTSLDLRQLMDEYYQKMFCAAAPEMKKFFEELELLWTTKMRGQFIDTDLGPMSLKPTEFETWKYIYSPAKLIAWEKLFNAAEKKVAKDKMSLARVRFMRKHFLAELQTFSRKFQEKENRANNLAAYAAPAGSKSEPLYLSRMKGEKTQIKAAVTVQNDGKALIFRFRADDPKTADLSFNPKKGDLKEFFSGTTFEIFLNPSRDRKTMYQVAISPAGTMYSQQHPVGKWGKGVQVSTKIGDKYWTAQVRIPFTILPNAVRDGFPANFSYNRRLKNAKPELHSWSPWLHSSFLEIDNFGRLFLNKPVSDNLISDFDFYGLKKLGRTAGKHWRLTAPRNKKELCDFTSEYFISGGQSVKMVGVEPKSRLRIEQGLSGKMKSNTKYRYSYYIKYDLEKNSTVYSAVGVGRNYFIPPLSIKGKRDWTLVTGEFKTGKLTEPQRTKHAHVGVTLSGIGTCYIDHLVLYEVK